MIFDDILEQQNLTTKKNLNAGVKKPTLQEIYAKFQAENQKPTSWLDQIAQNLPALAKIGSAAFIKNPWQQGAVQESLSGEQQRQDAMRQAYQQSQEQKQRDFLDIAYKQAGLDTEAEKSEQSSKQFEAQIGLQEKTLQQKMQEEALKKLQEETKAKQAQENWQKEYDLKQAELTNKKNSGANLTPEQKEIDKAKGEAAVRYKKLQVVTPNLIKDIDRAITLSDKAYSGVTAGIGEKIGRLGFAPFSKYSASDKLAASSELKLLTGQQVLDALSNLKGTVSDRDMSFMIDTMVGFDKATADEKKAKLNTVRKRLQNSLDNAKGEYVNLGGVVEEQKEQNTTEQKTGKVFEGTTKSGAKITVSKE